MSCYEQVLILQYLVLKVVMNINDIYI